MNLCLSGSSCCTVGATYLSDLVAFQSGHLLRKLLIGGVAQAQSAVVAVAEGEHLPIGRHHGRVLESTGHLEVEPRREQHYGKLNSKKNKRKQK